MIEVSGEFIRLMDNGNLVILNRSEVVAVEGNWSNHDGSPSTKLVTSYGSTYFVNANPEDAAGCIWPETFKAPKTETAPAP